MRGEVEEHAADDEKRRDGDAAHHAALIEHLARDEAEVFERLFVLLLRRNLPENP